MFSVISMAIYLKWQALTEMGPDSYLKLLTSGGLPALSCKHPPHCQASRSSPPFSIFPNQTIFLSCL